MRPLDLLRPEHSSHQARSNADGNERFQDDFHLSPSSAPVLAREARNPDLPSTSTGVRRNHMGNPQDPRPGSAADSIHSSVDMDDDHSSVDDDHYRRDSLYSPPSSAASGASCRSNEPPDSRRSSGGSTLGEVGKQLSCIRHNQNAALVTAPPPSDPPVGPIGIDSDAASEITRRFREKLMMFESSHSLHASPPRSPTSSAGEDIDEDNITRVFGRQLSSGSDW